MLSMIIIFMLLLSTNGLIKKNLHEQGLESRANLMGLETSIISINRLLPANRKSKTSKLNITTLLSPNTTVKSTQPYLVRLALVSPSANITEYVPLPRSVKKANSTKESTTAIAPPPAVGVDAAENDYGRLFYMYELDEDYWWKWPLNGTDCSNNGYVGHEHAVLSGMGRPLRPREGLFLTWHFSLFSSLFNRFKRSSRRTFDPERASLFIIPYDLGLDGYLDQRTCSESRRCTRGLAPKLQEMLLRNKYWTRYQGADHAVLWSLGQYHPWPHNGCDIFMKDFCRRCTFTCYWMDSTKPESRFISVPFPSAYHWWDGIEALPWDLGLAANRTMTAVYLGSTQTLNPAHTKIRRAMTTQCNSSSECHWLKIAHSSKDDSIADFLSVYKRAVFCLCPPGDDPARKAVFDSIVSGCIPVIFEKATLYNQYPWHIGEATALDISVSIPGASVRSGKLDFMSVLLAIPKEAIRLKQQALARVAPRVQYAMPPPRDLQDRFDSTPWDPPFPDAAEVTLDGLIRRVADMLANRSSGIPPREMLSKTWHQQYDVVRVQVPGVGISNNYSGAEKIAVRVPRPRGHAHRGVGGGADRGNHRRRKEKGTEKTRH